MNDLFRDKAADWDERPVPAQISEGVFAAIVARLSFDATQDVLDFGAGTGLLASKLAPHARRILAVDISAAMLEKLAAKPELAGKVEPICADIVAQPLSARVDRIVSAMAMHHVEDTDALLRALHLHLRPGGRLALADLDAEDGSFHPPGTEGVFHAGFDRAELARALEAAGFVEVAFETACVVHREGRDYPVFLATAAKPS